MPRLVPNVLVKVTCGRCQNTLHEATQAEAAQALEGGWTGSLRVPPCPTHDRPRSGQFGQWQAGAVERGEEPSMVLYREVLWADLQPHVERAYRLARTQYTAI